jgi:hypothetical protein
MHNPLIYTEKLLQFLEREENYPAMLEWIENLPELDQPDVFREMQAFYKERHLKTGEQDWLDKANLIANGLDDFQEEILNNKLDKALFMMQFDNVEFESEQVELFLFQSREAVIKIILSNPENRKEMMKIAQQIIKLEKESGVYEPANWIEIL